MDAFAQQQLLIRLENRQLNNPGFFRQSALFLASLPYVCVGLLLALTLHFLWQLTDEAGKHLLTGGLFINTIALFTFLSLLWVALRQLSQSPEVPKGRSLTRKDAPRLFEALDKMRRRLKAGPIHGVLIDDRLEVALHPVARFGIFGGCRNYLVIGLPGLLACDARETMAELAREYARISPLSGQGERWLWCMRPVVARILENLPRDTDNGLPNRLVRRALEIFAPRFLAASLVIARQQGFACDRLAADIAGQAASGNALIRKALLGNWATMVFWPRFLAQAETREEPQFMPYAAMRTAFTAAHAEWASNERLRLVMQPRSDPYDYQPILWKRLAAIEVKPSIPASVPRCAGQTLLREQLRTLVEAFDHDWWKRHRERWHERYRQIEHDRAQLSKLAERSCESLSSAQLIELAEAQARTGDTDAARQAIDELLTRPDCPRGRTQLLKARLLLAEGNTEGLEELQHAIASEPPLRPECLRLGYRFLVRAEGRAAADSWAAQLST